MDRRYYIFMIMLGLLAIGCSNDTEKKDSTAASIHKIWIFKKIDSTSTLTDTGSAWIGKNILNLTNNDTLRFNYKSNKAMPTSYPYKIMHDTIFVNNSPAYKVLKLTGDELDLYAIFGSKKSSGKDSVVMVYKAK